MNKRSIELYCLLFLTMLNVFIIMDLPKSHAKYFKEVTGDERTSYDTNIEQLGYDGTYDTSVYVGFSDDTRNVVDDDKVIYNVRIPKNNIMYVDPEGVKSDIADYYILNLINTSNSCQIITYDEDDNEVLSSSHTYELNGDYINAKVKCNILDQVQLKFAVNEYVVNYQNVQEETFTYISQTVRNNTASEIYAVYPKTVIISDSLYEKASNALDTYAEDKGITGDTLTLLRNYFKILFDDDNEITDDEFKTYYNNKSSITGFNGFTYVEEPETFTFDDNFLGYALTYYNHNSTPYYFSFSTSTTDGGNDTIFAYYVNTYITSITSEERSKIITYVSTTKGGVNNVLNYTPSNIEYVTKEASDITSVTRISIDQDILLDHIDALEHALSMPKVIANGEGMYDSLLDDIDAFATTNNDIMLWITAVDDTTLQSIVETNISSNSTFARLYIMTYDDKVVLFNIYSDGTDNTYVDISYLNVGDTITLQVLNSAEGTTEAINAINSIDSALYGVDNIEINSLGVDDGTGVFTQTVDAEDNALEPPLTFNVTSDTNYTYITYTIRTS